ncbi:alpha/beta hydrolase [Seongchinamella sediminis]|uniref:Alpha/beta hydrolase n=1 Tax=Seongchinamella sediminis TaxID=2283635 RepID=A0A3L7DZE7_9GAMM|nr:alpha/beta hydrolase [Seongchinamella sediminis]RLQ21361.1 alpha/beta hydrolase [Seongchinamella sediminis]
MSQYDIDPAYLGFPNIRYVHNRWWLRAISMVLRVMRINHRWDDDIEVRKHRVTGVDANSIRVLEIASCEAGRKAPAIVYLHGGAFFLTYAGLHLDNAQRYARTGQCRVFLVDYRLSTQAPFPAAQDDCQSALEWVHDNAAALGIDKERLLVAGDSAGGCLAASCTHMTQDRNRHRGEAINIRAQLLIYPVTDCEAKTASANSFTDTPLWTRDGNRLMWDLYLGQGAQPRGTGGAGIPRYASPAHRESLQGLPSAYIEVAQFDPLHDEACDYARALQADGVPVQLVETEHTVHGYDAVDCDRTRKYMARRLKALKNFLQ